MGLLHAVECVSLRASAEHYAVALWCAGLTNADQRITEDVEKFSFAIADLFSYTFKPLLDVILFTRSLSRIMGYKGQVPHTPNPANSLCMGSLWLSAGGCEYYVQRC